MVQCCHIMHISHETKYNLYISELLAQYAYMFFNLRAESGWLFLFLVSELS